MKIFLKEVILFFFLNLYKFNSRIELITQTLFQTVSKSDSDSYALIGFHDLWSYVCC